MSSTIKHKDRLIDIDKAKGFAIFLVVFGHIVATDMPLGNEWYATLKFFIYKFHMPFFMFISGIIMSYTFPSMNNTTDYYKYIYKKLKRLSLGYIIFGITIYLGKIYLSKLIYVDDIPNDIYSEIYNLLVVPSQSAGGSLWFIYVLMEMYIVFPFIIVHLIKKPLLIIITGIALEFMPATSTFMIDRFFEYFLFFSIGVITIHHYKKFLIIIDRYYAIFIFLFILSFFIVQYVPDLESKVIISILSMPALLGLMRNTFLSKIPTWEIFGKYTYSIYLMNTILIGITKGIILKYMTWNGENFLFIAPILLVFGIYGPILVKKYILVKLPILDRATT